MVPLHYACVSNAANQLEVVITLFDANADSINIDDSQGRTSMQVLKFTAFHQTENKIYPLHHLAATSENLKVKSLQLLVNVYPESTQTPDKNGMLPFHHACLNQALSLEVLMLFISLYPEALKYF
jgi:ankyrin repeat protein